MKLSHVKLHWTRSWKFEPCAQGHTGGSCWQSVVWLTSCIGHISCCCICDLPIEKNDHQWGHMLSQWALWIGQTIPVTTNRHCFLLQLAQALCTVCVLSDYNHSNYSLLEIFVSLILHNCGTEIIILTANISQTTVARGCSHDVSYIFT